MRETVPEARTIRQVIGGIGGAISPANYGGKMKKKKLNLPRVPFPRQTEKVVPAEKGGRHNRNRDKARDRKEIKAYSIE